MKAEGCNFNMNIKAMLHHSLSCNYTVLFSVTLITKKYTIVNFCSTVVIPLAFGFITPLPEQRKWWSARTHF